MGNKTKMRMKKSTITTISMPKRSNPIMSDTKNVTTNRNVGMKNNDEATMNFANYMKLDKR